MQDTDTSTLTTVGGPTRETGEASYSQTAHASPVVSRLWVNMSTQKVSSSVSMRLRQLHLCWLPR